MRALYPLPMRAFPRILVAWLFLMALAGSARANSEENPRFVQQGNTGMMGIAIGHHQTWNLAFPAFFPMLELRAGYNPLDNLQFRIDIGGGACYVAQSEVESFEGAALLILNAQLGIFWTPRLGDSLTLRLGPTIAWWMTALYGDNLTGISGTAGSRVDHLQNDAQAFGGILGVDIDLDDSWALSVEARYNMAGVNLGEFQGDSGGLTLLVGFVYRTAPWDLDSP